LTQYELSRLVKIPPPRISLLERGLVSPSLAEMQRIARVLESKSVGA
jgi:predicted transcriptional regulator